MEWRRTNGVRFAPDKTEAVLFSRNRRHWRDRTSEHITIGTHQVGFNVKATRWLGIYLDSSLGFSEHVARGAHRAKTAEQRLRSTVTRHGVPPIAARHLDRKSVV